MLCTIPLCVKLNRTNCFSSNCTPNTITAFALEKHLLKNNTPPRVKELGFCPRWESFNIKGSEISPELPRWLQPCAGSGSNEQPCCNSGFAAIPPPVHNKCPLVTLRSAPFPTEWFLSAEFSRHTNHSVLVSSARLIHGNYVHIFDLRWDLLCIFCSIYVFDLVTCFSPFFSSRLSFHLKDIHPTSL